MAETPLIERVSAHLERTRLLQGPATALLAVSGGPDSLAMLDLLASLAPGLGLSLVVAHADHGILPESASVAARVTELSRSRYGLDCVTAALALGSGASETRSRIARYRFLRRAQAERSARYLVTAHHADDQAETVILRLLRGSAPPGLAGIAARGPGGLVRPLLPFRRDELAAHAAAAGLPVFLDPTNVDPTHTRAWVRHRVLPLLASRLGDETVGRLLEVARHARAELLAWDRLLDQLPDLGIRVAEGRFEVARDPLRRYHNVLGGRILRAIGRRSGIRLGPRLADRLAGFAAAAESGRRMDLGSRFVAEVAFERLIVSGAAKPPEPVRVTTSEGTCEFAGFEFAWRPELAPVRVPREGWTTWVSGDALWFRVPGPGDRLRPVGGVGHRPVRRLLMEAGVSRQGRRVYPLVVRGREILWVPGVCRAEAALPAPGTTALRIDARVR